MTIALIIMAYSLPVIAFFAFYLGFKVGKGVNTNKDIMLPKIAKNKAVSETKEERMQRILAENIENFGTNTPQKEVE